MRARSDQRVDRRCSEVLAHSGNEPVLAVQVVAPRRDERIELGEAAQIDAGGDPRLERRSPPAHRAAHRQSQRDHRHVGETLLRAQPVVHRKRVGDAHAPQRAAFPEQALVEHALARRGPVPEAPVIDRNRSEAALRQAFTIGRNRERRTTLQQFAAADRKVIAMRMAIKDNRAWRSSRHHDGGRDVHGIVHIETPVLDRRLARIAAVTQRSPG